jgi:hypothetical protein
MLVVLCVPVQFKLMVLLLVTKQDIVTVVISMKVRYLGYVAYTGDAQKMLVRKPEWKRSLWRS